MYNSIYPTYVNSYLGINNRISKKRDDEKASQNAAEKNEESSRAKGAVSEKENSQAFGNYFPNGEKVAVDYTKKQIHISQVLSDFRNTANAIGTPPEIREEVDKYLELVDSQSKKETPNKQIVTSNLKNASQILDEYISKTLKKPSKVVENWVETLFLQQVDLKQETPVEEEVTENVAIEETVPEENVEDKEYEVFPEDAAVKAEEKSSDFYIPDDPELKRLFIRAKKYAAINEKEKALFAFQNVTEYAEGSGDLKVSAMGHYEQGVLYNDFELPEDALFNFNLAAKQTDDNNIKAKAHLSMGQIYDDYVKFEPALKHLTAAVSFAGEADNLKLQAGALSGLAKIHADKYDKENTVKFMDLASLAAEETQNDKFKGVIYNKNAKFCEKLDDKIAALHYYGSSAAEFEKAEDNSGYAKNCIAAAEIMLKYGNKAKARKLLQKAYSAAYETNNTDLQKEVTDKLVSL